MALAQARIDIISNYIMADSDRAQKLIKLPAEEAAAVMKQDGLDVTAEELKGFVSLAEKQLQQGELTEENLENVSGGIGVAGSIAIGCLIALGSGIVVGGMEKFNIW